MPFSALHEAFSQGRKKEEAAEEEEEGAVEEAASQLAVALGKTSHLSGHIKHIVFAQPLNKGGPYVFWIILIGARRDDEKIGGKSSGTTRNIFFGVSFQFSFEWTKSHSKHVELIARGN